MVRNNNMGESSFPILCIGFILKLFLDTFEGLLVVFMLEVFAVWMEMLRMLNMSG